MLAVVYGAFMPCAIVVCLVYHVIRCVDLCILLT